MDQRDNEIIKLTDARTGVSFIKVMSRWPDGRK